MTKVFLQKLSTGVINAITGTHTRPKKRRKGDCEMRFNICPSCKSGDTYQEQDWIGKELRHCESCGTNYEVEYELEIKKITIVK
jgi:uncharacterized protein (DUF983 family)